MERLLLNLVRHISKSMPQLKVVDEDYGQLEMIDMTERDTYPLTFPAVLIDAPDVSWDNIGGFSQKGLATVRARLIIDCYDDTHSTSGTEAMIEGRENMRKRLFESLQGHRIDSESVLIRTSSKLYTFNHGIKVYEETYTLELTEMLEKPTLKVVAPKISLKVSSL